MTSREQKIVGLSDQQALSIVDSLAGEFANEQTPQGQSDQTQALQALFEQQGQTVDVAKAVTADSAASGEAARQLLMFMAQVPAVQPSLDEWLDAPPTQEMAALPLLLLAPVVLTGCLLVLQVAAQTRIEHLPDGHITWKYDPSMETPLGKQLGDIIKSMAELMGNMATGGVSGLIGGKDGEPKDEAKKDDKPT